MSTSFFQLIKNIAKHIDRDVEVSYRFSFMFLFYLFSCIYFYAHYLSQSQKTSDSLISVSEVIHPSFDLCHSWAYSSNMSVIHPMKNISKSILNWKCSFCSIILLRYCCSGRSWTPGRPPHHQEENVRSYHCVPRCRRGTCSTLKARLTMYVWLNSGPVATRSHQKIRFSWVRCFKDINVLVVQGFKMLAMYPQLPWFEPSQGPLFHLCPFISHQIFILSNKGKMQTLKWKRHHHEMEPQATKMSPSDVLCVWFSFYFWDLWHAKM